MLKEIIAILATILVTVGYIPQIIKGYKTKTLEDLSMGLLTIIGLGVLLWVFYGILNKDTIFLIANTIILSFLLTLIIMKIYYDRAKS